MYTGLSEAVLRSAGCTTADSRPWLLCEDLWLPPLCFTGLEPLDSGDRTQAVLPRHPQALFECSVKKEAVEIKVCWAQRIGMGRKTSHRPRAQSLEPQDL